MKNMFVITAAFLFSGCMHFMMTGNHDGSSSQVQPAYEKEVVAGSIKASAVFPLIRVDKEMEITVRLNDVEANHPIKNATVVAEFSPLHDIHEDSTVHKQESVDEVHAEEQQAGKYVLRFTPAHAAQYMISIRVTAIAGKLLQQPVLMTTTREVVEEMGNHSHGGMHSIGKSTTMLIVGGAIMAAMMIGMLLVRGGMF
ncbi:MAG TPA: hypothetical protein VFF29_04140 [Bacteroidota bacterium]|nr:hypothetical protein [Bacteroidota bacterium]